MSILSAAGNVLGAVGADQANDQTRQYLNAAMGQLKTGASNASGYQQPIYDQSLQNFQNLSGANANGNFSMPTSSQISGGNFQGPTASNFQTDPGYQFSLGQGLDQIKAQAAQGGMEHSPQTTKALTDYATNSANQEYNDIYNRQQNTYNTNTNQQLATQGQAWNQNFQNNNQNFNRGLSLTQNLPTSANQLSGIASNLGTGLANIETEKGGLAAQNAALPYGAAQTSLAQFGQTPQTGTGANGGVAQPPASGLSQLTGFSPQMLSLLGL